MIVCGSLWDGFKAGRVGSWCGEEEVHITEHRRLSGPGAPSSGRGKPIKQLSNPLYTHIPQAQNPGLIF